MTFHQACGGACPSPVSGPTGCTRCCRSQPVSPRPPADSSCGPLTVAGTTYSSGEITRARMHRLRVFVESVLEPCEKASNPYKQRVKCVDAHRTVALDRGHGRHHHGPR